MYIVDSLFKYSLEKQARAKWLLPAAPIEFVVGKVA